MRNKSVKKAAHISMLGCMLLSGTAMAATLEDVDQRLGKLEDEVKMSQEEAADLAERAKNAFAVAGYADIEYVASDAASVKSGFRIHHLSLMFKKPVSKDLRFFSEIEYEDGPYMTSPGSVTGKLLVEAANFDYSLRHDTTLRVGRFFTPAGIWSVDHYPPYVATQERPLHIRKIFPQVTDGATLSGHHAAGDAFVNYDLFVGNGETSAFDGNGDSNSSTAAGLRVNASLPLAKVFDVGATLYREQMKVSASDAEQSEKAAIGIHAKIKEGNFGFQGEYADGTYKPTLFAAPATAVAPSYHRKGYYGQFTYDINKYTLGYRYDYYDPKSTATSDSTKVNSLIVNYHVDKNTVLKWEHHLYNTEGAAPDYYKSIVTIAVNFD